MSSNFIKLKSTDNIPKLSKGDELTKVRVSGMLKSDGYCGYIKNKGRLENVLSGKDYLRFQKSPSTSKGVEAIVQNSDSFLEEKQILKGKVLKAVKEGVKEAQKSGKVFPYFYKPTNKWQLGIYLDKENKFIAIRDGTIRTAFNPENGKSYFGFYKGVHTAGKLLPGTVVLSKVTNDAIKDKKSSKKS